MAGSVPRAEAEAAVSARITRYEIRDAQGVLVAVHVRRDRDDGGKQFAWEQPGGVAGLNGLPTAQLPLYGSEDVARGEGDEPIILVEGEKARDALRQHGFRALATVTGAANCPGPEPLRVVRGIHVIQWPDADDAGRRHMRKLAERLSEIAASVRVFEWAGAPEHGDAADYLDTGADAPERLRIELARARPVGEWLTTSASAPSAQQVVAAAFDGLTEKSSRDERTAGLRRLAAAARDRDALDSAAIKHEARDRLHDFGVGLKEAQSLVAAALLIDVPTAASTLQGSPLALADPAPWPEQVDGSALADEIAALFRHYVALPKAADVALALWTLHAHAHDAAEISPVLVLRSPGMRCGKTTTLLVLGALAPRSQMASNLTSALLYRTVEKYRPTLLVDEAEGFLLDNEELRGILNAGHVRGTAVVPRLQGDDYEPRLFSTWCPKAVALIGRLPATLEDRSIVVALRRKARSETVARLRQDRLHEHESLRRCAWRWAHDHLEELRRADPSVPLELHDRAQDNWRPLLAIADAIGGEWPVLARRAAVALAEAAPISDGAVEILLADLRELFNEKGTDRLPSAEIVAALVDREDRPWVEWKHDKPLTARQLAALLKRFEIEPHTIRFGNGTTAKGYYRDRFEDAWGRYLSPDRPSEPSHGNDAGTMRAEHDSRSGTRGRAVTDKTRLGTAPIAACDGVTVQEPPRDGLAALPPGPLQDFLNGIAPGAET
jgi:putative DNA primase/helicase